MGSKQIILALGIAALIGQFLTAGLIYWGAWNYAGTRSSDGVRLLADATARNVQRSVIVIDRSLAGAAANLAALDLSRPEVVSSAEERLKATIPFALVIRILPAGINSLDESRAPKMGYADLEMVKQAATGETGPGAHEAGTPDAHIAMARGIPEKAAVILASLSMSLIKESLPTVQEGAGIDLHQDSLSVAYQGDPNLQGGAPTGSVPIPKTPWAIAYWASASHSATEWWILLTPLLVIVLTAAAFASALRRLGRLSEADQEEIVRLVQDIAGGRRLDLYAMRLAEYNGLAQKIAQIRHEQLPAEATSSPALKADLGEVHVAEIDGQDEPQTIKKSVPKSIFRAYDIRGIVGDTLNPEIAQDIGRAIGSEAHLKGDQRVFVARDGRQSSPELSAALIKGLQATGRTVVDLGLAPTPLLYFATHTLNGKSGVVVTGSHNPANYNGFKVVIGGDTLAEEGIQQLCRRIEAQDFISGIGRVENRELSSEYIDRILEDMQLGRSMKVVVDAGNGAAGKIAPALLKAMGCDVVELYCEIDGKFPNHHPDPSKPENLAMLIKTVIEEEADLGVAFDGDGDRLGMVDAKGKVIWPDRQMMVFAADVLSRQPGADIIYDVKCSRHLASYIVKNGGRPMMWKTGHSLIKAKMKQTGAMLAGEMSGHIFFKERWFGFDDGIYACARMIEILSGDPRTTNEVFEELPDSISTPELNVPLAEGRNVEFVEKLKGLAQFPEARIIDIDGLRVDFVDGWGLVRASNTTPSLVIRFEADDETALKRVQEIFRRLILKIDPTLVLPF